MSLAHPLEKKNILFDQAEKRPVSSLVMGKSKYRHAARKKKKKKLPKLVTNPTKGVGDSCLLFLVLVFLGLLRTCLLSL